MDGVLQDVIGLVQPHRRQAPADSQIQGLSLVPSRAQLLAVSLCKVVGREDDVIRALAPDHLLSRVLSSNTSQNIQFCKLTVASHDGIRTLAQTDCRTAALPR